MDGVGLFGLQEAGNTAGYFGLGLLLVERGEGADFDTLFVFAEELIVVFEGGALDFDVLAGADQVEVSVFDGGDGGDQLLAELPFGDLEALFVDLDGHAGLIDPEIAQERLAK